MDLALRIASEFQVVVAKKGDLFREYQEAMRSLHSGDTAPMLTLAHKVEDLVLPGGKAAPWVHGLGAARVKALDTMQRVLSAFIDKAPRMQPGSPDLEMALRVLPAIAPGFQALESVTTTTEKREPLHVSGFNLIEMPGLTRTQVKGAVESLEKAASEVRAKFPQVIYGEVYLATTLSLKNAAAFYAWGKDTLYLNIKAKKRYDDIYTIIHELGHRYDAKFLGPKRDEYVELSKSSPVTPYGATHPRENFAEGFAHFVLGKPLPEPVEAFFKGM